MEKSKDNFSKMRESLIKSLAEKGISNERVLSAIGSIPRELFIPAEIQDKAYLDSALPIDCGQTISQPYTVAYMSQLLNAAPGQKVLEIGTGSGYQSAVIYKMGAELYSVERHESLHFHAKELFEKMGYNINLKLGDGSLGWEEHAPYDGAIITAAAPDFPKTIISQLKIGGKLVAPIGNEDSQSMYIITKTSENKYEYEKLDKFKFVPLIGREGWE